MRELCKKANSCIILQHSISLMVSIARVLFLFWVNQNVYSNTGGKQKEMVITIIQKRPLSMKYPSDVVHLQL